MTCHRGFSFVYGHLVVALANIAPVCVRHFSRAVYNAAHNGDNHILKMSCASLYFFKGLLKVVHGTAATRAGNVLRLVEPASAGLQKLVLQILAKTGSLYIDSFSVSIDIGAGKDNVINLFQKQHAAKVAGRVPKQALAGR